MDGLHCTLSHSIWFFLSFRLKPTSLVSQHEVFFTQENYKKHSCRPSFVEFLEKHLSPDKDEQNRLPQNDITMGSSEAAEYNMSKGTSKTGAEKSRSNSAPACLGPAMEFPFISKISIESQEMFLKVFETLRSGKLANVDLQEMKAVQVCDCITVTYYLIITCLGWNKMLLLLLLITQWPKIHVQNIVLSGKINIIVFKTRK